jgi:AcrR family transcriptional regulator
MPMATIDPTHPSPQAKAMRADARVNREKLLHAASEHFASDGPDASPEAIARGAGVGIGTLYRHFPTREALIEAVYRNEVDQLCAAAGELLAAGIAAKTIRPDVTAEDVLTSMNAVWTIAAGGERWAAQARRVLRLLMDGLRFGAAP